MNNENWCNGGEAFNVEAAGMAMIISLPFDSPLDCWDAHRAAGRHLRVALQHRAERMQRDHEHRVEEQKQQEEEDPAQVDELADRRKERDG